MIAYTFIGYKGITPETVNVLVSDDGIVSAETSVGGMTAISYDNYDPLPANDAVIFENTVPTGFGDAIKTSLHWQVTYPFAYSTLEVVPEPTPSVFISNIATTAQSAVGVNDGTATITATGGTTPYEYSVNGIDYQSSNVITGLAPGAYSGFVRDNVGDVYSQPFSIVAAEYPTPDEYIPTRDVIIESGSNLYRQGAYKRVEVLSEFGKVPTVLYNGDFEKWDGFNWQFWTKYGGINVDRFKRSVINGSGTAIPVENYGIIFNERVDIAKYIEHTAVPVQKGDTVKMSYRVGKTEGTGTTQGTIKVFSKLYADVTYRRYYMFKMRVRVGNFYLYNADAGTSYEWVEQLATVSHKIENPNGDLNSYTFNFNIPECPVQGQMYVQLFGFNPTLETAISEAKNGFVTIKAKTTFDDLPTYTPTPIDDLTLIKTSQSGDNDTVGILSISENLRLFTIKPERIVIPFGDYFYRALQPQPLDNLYAMTLADGSYTAGWYEYGVVNKPVPIGLALAKSIMRIFQSPFWYWNGDLIKKVGSPDFNILTTYSFEVDGSPSFNRKIFGALSGDIDYKYNTFHSVKLAELFNKPAKSNDISIPYYPDSPNVVFTQDPTTTVNNGIFTDEFTDEFN